MFGPTPLPRTLEASLRDVSSDDAKVRASAFADLARHTDADGVARTRIVAALERGILREDDVRVRVAAVLAVADLEATEVVPAVLMATEDDAPFVRELAVRALGELGDARALPKVRRLLDDERPELRYQAVAAWSRLPHETVDERLVPILAAFRRPHELRDVKLMVLRVLDEIVDRGPLEGAPADLDKLLREALEDDGTALLSALVLAKLGDAEGRRVVGRFVARRPLPGSVPSEDDREAILIAGRFRWPELVPSLLRRARGIGRFLADTCATESLVALAALGDARSIAELERLVRKARGANLDALALLCARARVAPAASWFETRVGAGAVVAEALDELRALGQENA